MATNTQSPQDDGWCKKINKYKLELDHKEFFIHSNKLNMGAEERAARGLMRDYALVLI